MPPSNAGENGAGGQIVFYLPFDDDAFARTPELEIEPTAGSRVVVDISQSVTLEQLAAGGVTIEEEGGKITTATDNRIEFVPGIRGRAARLKAPLEYYFPRLKKMQEGTIAMWYRDCSCDRVNYQKIPAMLTTTYDKFLMGDRSQLQDWWDFEKYTAPAHGVSVDWQAFSDARGKVTPRSGGSGWHFWALRWNRTTGLLQAVDDGIPRDTTIYSRLMSPMLYGHGNDWVPEPRDSDEFSLEDGIGQESFDIIFRDRLYIRRNCEITVDEVAVWNRALSLDELKQAFDRGAGGGEVWPVAMLPVPKRGRDEGLDLTDLPSARPPLPRQVEWSDKGAYIRETPTMRSVCLNGYWRYQPAVTRLAPPDSTQDWRYIRLPGAWYTPVSDEEKASGYPRVYSSSFELLKRSAVYWNGKELETYAAHWFERDVPVPASDKKKRYLLRFNRADPQATTIDFYWEGNFAGHFYTFGQDYMDVTDFVKPGQTNRINIVVQDRASMLFDLFLEEQDLHEVSTHDLFMIPDWRNRSITAQFEIDNHTDVDQTFRYGVEFLEWKTGRKAHELECSELTVPPGRTVVEIDGKWPDVHPWSIYDPFLYTAVLTVRDSDNRLLHRALPVRFGYRDLWSENGWYYLNGSKLHNRGVGQPNGDMGYSRLVDSGRMKETAARWYARQKSINSYWKRLLNRYGIDDILDIADQAGGFGGYKLHGGGNLFDGRAQSMQCAITFARWLRNHPSFVNYTVRQNQDAEEEHSFEEYNRVWEEYIAPLKKVHPTCMCHGMWRQYGTDMWPSVGKHAYGLALQSREELGKTQPYMGSHMSKVTSRDGKTPARYNAEFGWPQISRNAFDGTGDFQFSEERWSKKTQIMEEFGAIYFGDEAYRQNASQSNGVSGSCVSFDWDYVRNLQNVGHPFTMEHDVLWGPIFSRLRMLFVDRNIPAWRWYGFGYWEHTESMAYFNSDYRHTNVDSGKKKRTYVGTRRPGIYYDDTPREKIDLDRFRENSGFTRIGEIVRRHQGPVAAWIFGRPDVASRDHAFYSGETITKQIGVISEYPWPVSLVLKWRAEDRTSGDVIADGEIPVNFETGDQKLLDMTIDAPDVKEKKKYRIVLETSMGDKVVHNHEFMFEVFPPHSKAGIKGKILLIDSGDTGAMLKAAGIDFDRFTGRVDPSAYDLLVVGRKCDHAKVREIFRNIDIDTLVNNGLNVLFLAQEGEVLDRPEPDPWPKLMVQTRSDCRELVSFGLRQERRSARYVFIRNPGHPLFEGLENEDMRNWRGESDLIKAWTPEYWFEFVPGRLFRESNMSNLGDVATYLFEKPQGGNFVSLLDSQFDLLYTALLEELRGKGKIVFCQLNLVNRYGRDPVATLFTDRLVAYALKHEPVPEKHAAFLGNDLWDRALKNLPFDFKRIGEEDSFDALDDAMVLCVGLGTPRIEDFDEDNRFSGVEAEPAVGVDPKFMKALDKAIDNEIESALTDPGGKDEDAVFDEPDDGSEDVTRAVKAIEKRERHKDIAHTWLAGHKSRIEQFVKDGGTVIVMPVVGPKDLDWLPFNVELAKEKVYAVVPSDFFANTHAIGPSDLYWRRALELYVPKNLPEGSLDTDPAVFSRIPWGKGEFIICQAAPGMIFGDWADSKLNRVMSAVMTEAGVRDNLDIDLAGQGYQEGGFPYFCCTLYFDPLMSRHW